MRTLLGLLGLWAGIWGAATAQAAGPATPEEMQAKTEWVREHLLAPEAAVVSFGYGQRKSSELLPAWTRSAETLPQENGRTQHRLRWADPATGLELRIVAVEYADYPVVEWTGYLKNTAATDTPLLSGLQAIDVLLRQPAQPATLRTIRGDSCTAESYEPLAFPLEEQARDFAAVGGRPTNGAFPYFNLDFGTEGVLLALGWPGQWAAHFAREGDALRLRGGQELTHLTLRTGEEIRTPLVALLFWKGDWLRGQNLWRRWMVAHNLPRPAGKLPGHFNAWCTTLHTSAAETIAALDACRKADVPYDHWWMDAGWYEGSEWWIAPGVGTWTPDPARFPKGIREVADHVHAQGMKLLLWFEPERACRGSWLWEHHPEWLLEWNGSPDIRVVNLGIPEARQWITDRVSDCITREGVDFYRQDHNVDPLWSWRKNDAEDRQGMTENLCVQGYLAYWDALAQRHPGMPIDACASGGRRNDLETLRRGVPLLRSDYQGPVFPQDPAVHIGNQGHTYGLSLWVPYYGTGVTCEDLYGLRSHWCPALTVGTYQEHWDLLKQRLAEYRQTADYFYGDFYPLLPYSRARDVWMAWEFVRPEQGDGMLQVFRREECPTATACLPLRGLEAASRYRLTDLDGGQSWEASGQELMAPGLRLEISAPRSAKIYTFQEIRETGR